jgi:hypothetical protein
MAGVCPPCPPQRNPRITFLDNVGDQLKFDLYVDNVLTFSNIGYQQQTAYRVITPGQHSFSSRSTTGGYVHNTSLETKAGNDYTLIMQGVVTQTPDKAYLGAYVDNNNGASNGNARARYIQAAAGFPPLDVYVNGVLLQRDVKYPAISILPYFEVTPGSLDITVRLAGTQTVVATKTVQVTQDNVTTFTQSGVYGIEINPPAPPSILVFSTPAL